MEEVVWCGSCWNALGVPGITLEESRGTPVEERAPCSFCGSRVRSFDPDVTGSPRVGIAVRAKVRPEGGGKPYYDSHTKDDVYRDEGGRWVRRSVVIDRRNDWYSEHVVDPKTGETIYECEEPLSAHQGRGSARDKKDPRNE
jgi:hypothetical protein